MSRELQLGIAQITGLPYAPGENLARTVDVATGLFEAGARLVVLPELIVPGYALDRERLRAAAQPLDGEAVHQWAELAGRHDGYIAAGLAERAGDDVFNAAVLVGPEGVVLHYRKLHLFQAERSTFTPGDHGLPIARLPFGTVGLCICYDLRFVETVRALSLKGAELVCVPTAWVAGFDNVSWDEQGYCPQARGALLQANLDQVFVACVSQGRTDPDGPAFLGSSVVVDPYGQVLLGPSSGTDEAIELVTVDLDQVARSHDRATDISPRNDRRKDVYRLAIDGELL